MDPATAIAIIQAIVAAYPVVSKGIEAIIADVAAARGLDPIALTKAITEPGIAAVDASVDAEINARFPG